MRKGPIGVGPHKPLKNGGFTLFKNRQILFLVNGSFFVLPQLIFHGESSKNNL